MTNIRRIGPSNPFEKFEMEDIHQGIHQRFEKQAAKYAKRIAINDPERTLTYETLNQYANNIAHAIISRVGSGLGQVSFVLQNDAFSIAALLGILKAGKAYVPLDPNFPKDRTSYMFQNSESILLLTDQAHRELALEISSGSVPLLLLEEIHLHAASRNPSLKVDPAATAYILYTSGSTGLPKGIAFGHRNLLHTTMCLINNLHISAEDRMTQLHSTSFAASVVDIYCALLNGASVFPWDVKARGVGGLAKWLKQEQVTSIQWIPTPFRQLVQSMESGEQFDSVRLLVMASEPLTRREYELYCRHFPDASFLVNQMGTSESYNYYLFFANKQTQFEGSIVPAGFPVSDDREVLLFDEERKAEVKSGETGEIVIRSEFMSLGYWKQPELTQKAFRTDATFPNKQLYFTGDIGKRLVDGCLIHLGRRDFQVKIRGYRIELPEVELAVKRLKHIQDVAVMARQDQKGELKLVAYYITDQQKDLSVTELRRQLAGNLPDYMIPNVFMRVQEFPMTPSGKMDKNLLPALTDERPVLENDLIAARNESEAKLLQIWKEVLGCKELGIADNFFELGGDSLQAAELLHLIHERFGVEVGYSSLMQAPRVGDLALLIERARLEARGQFVGVANESKGEPLLRGVLNRVLQVLALYAPGLTSLRVWLHRWRGVHIGNNVAIGTSAIIETAHPELVWIGNNVAIGIRNVIIGHFSDSIDRNDDAKGPTVRIQDNVYIGPNVTILPNVTIGEGAVLTAGSVINKSVPPRTMMQGNPAKAVAICEVPLVGEGRTYEEFLRHLRPVNSGE